LTVDSVEVSIDLLSDEEIAALDFSDLAPAEPVEADQIAQSEGFWRTFDRLQLFWQSWEPEAGPTRGVVALMHGFGEHSSRYDHVAAALCRAGYGVVAIDARGHGRSTGRRAHVGEYDNYVQDYDLLKMHTAARWPGLDLFCFGHSNGGLIALRYALTQPDNVAGFVVTSPFCGFAMEVPKVKAAAGRVMSKVWPTFSMPSGLDASKVSHIEKVVEKYKSDPLVLDNVSSRWFTETTKAQEDLLERAGELDQAFLFLVAGQDEIVDARATEEVFHRMGSGDREMELFPKLYHEILNEEPWEDIVRRAVRWMEGHRQKAASRTQDKDQP
jgi:alpha-beta hydrolase superfamily lysophospholipase